LVVPYSNADSYDRDVSHQFQCTKVKVKFTLEEAIKAQRGSRDIALPFL
jgi:hypothetical protein